MAETRELGRIQKVDVMLAERQPHLVVLAHLADGTSAALSHPIAGTLLRDYLDVWGADALQLTHGRHCWVIRDLTEIKGLEPLMPDEGDALMLTEKRDEAAPTPTTKPAEQASTLASLQAEWKTLLQRARAANISIDKCRPTKEMSVGDVQALIEVARTTVEGAEEQAARETQEVAA